MSLFIGIDVGGTHTDGVAVDGKTGKLLHKVKVHTTLDLRECSLGALESLLEVIDPAKIDRVVLSTTLVTNAVVMGKTEPTGLIVLSGPGANPSFLVTDEDSYLVRGSIDHRGRQLTSIEEDEIKRIVEKMHLKGVSVLAVSGKFSGRNPSHEKMIAKIADHYFDHIALSHRLSGALNFPRRAVTAFLSAGVWRRHENFIDAMTLAVREKGITAPLYLLRADGGAGLASSFDNAAEAALSGPAASIMGADALDTMEGETVTLDIGGTTTDIALLVDGVPLLEPHGATVGKYKTQIRALYNRSIAVGGDSEVTLEDKLLKVGPGRKGKAAAMGGPAPTPTDALVILGHSTVGDRSLAASAVTPLAERLNISVEETAELILKEMARLTSSAVENFVEEVNSRPVYTLHELLEGHKVEPTRAVIVGGPGKGLLTYIEEALGLCASIPDHYDVANAIGAAVARVSVEVNATGDTARGHLAIPEAGIYRSIGRDFTAEDLEDEAREALLGIAREKGLEEDGGEPEVLERESFNIIEGYSRTGAVHRMKIQIKPSILCRIGGES